MLAVTGAQKYYNGDVRHYTTKPMNGDTTFKCAYCDHNVTTLDFNSTNGTFGEAFRLRPATRRPEIDSPEQPQMILVCPLRCSPLR